MRPAGGFEGRARRPGRGLRASAEGKLSACARREGAVPWIWREDAEEVKVSGRGSKRGFDVLSQSAGGLEKGRGCGATWAGRGDAGGVGWVGCAQGGFEGFVHGRCGVVGAV